MRSARDLTSSQEGAQVAMDLFEGSSKLASVACHVLLTWWTAGASFRNGQLRQDGKKLSDLPDSFHDARPWQYRRRVSP